MIRLGTRGSDLALWQARHVAARLEQAGESCEIVVLVTRGDRIDDVPLQSVEGKGFFTSEIEQALMEGRIDLAVHSHKDLPSEMPAGLVIAAVPTRVLSGEKLLCLPSAHDPAGLFLPLARGARVGTSAPRRTAQLAALRGDLTLLPLRGNVPTRVRRLREGRYDAIVLAAAGLLRLELDLSGLEVTDLSPTHFVPAPGQGALAIQTRGDDARLRALCERVLADPGAAATVAAERSLLTALGGGCNLPLGVALDEVDGLWRAATFLGAGHPRPDHAARWCQASAASPGAAVAAAEVLLREGRQTGQGPLAQLVVALTGSTSAAEDLAARLTTLGARVQREDVLEIEPLECPELASRIAALGAGDALAFTSANAARRMQGLTVPSGVRVVAVGPATAQALRDAGQRVDLVGEGGAHELVTAMDSLPGSRVLFPCAEGARTDLQEELAAREVAVERLPLYRTRPRTGAALGVDANVRLYLSPSAVAAALTWEREASSPAPRVALGSATAAALADANLAHLRAPSTAAEDLLATLIRASATPASALLPTAPRIRSQPRARDR